MTRKNVGAAGRAPGKPKQKVQPPRRKKGSNLGGMSYSRSSCSAPISTSEVAKTGSSIVLIKDTEKIRDIPFSTSFQKWVHQIQPGNPGMFPRLSRRAVTFEKYRFRSLWLEYTGSCPTDHMGVVAAVKYENLARSEPNSLADMMNNSHAAQCAPWKGFRLNLLERVDNRWRYIEDDLTLPANRDSRMDTMGKIVLSSSAAGASNDLFCGSFWIHYEIELDTAASLDFASPLNEWTAISETLSEVNPANLPLLPLISEAATNSYGNLRIVELPDPISGTEYCLAPLEPVEGTFVVTALAAAGGLVATDGIRAATNSSYGTSGQSAGEIWNWSPISNFVSNGGTSLVALVEAKATALMQNLESYLIKFAVTAAAATITSIRVRFFPNDVPNTVLPWPPGHSGVPTKVYHPASDHIQNALRDFFYYRQLRLPKPLTAEKQNELLRPSHSRSPFSPFSPSPPPTVTPQGAPAKFEFIGRTPCPSEASRNVASPAVVADKERSASTTAQSSVLTPPSSQGCPPSEHELNLLLAELKALKTALYSKKLDTSS